ncbi:MAG: SAM-dependent chlorinase/fluorinase [Candidatus Izimaplasma sp.]|nr:SAM-dependent chlorinase/fluorinase [Candidatus Izimaplasma bacterium]
MNKKILVFQSDFGLLKGSVSQMYGTAIKVDSDLKIFDITHNIPQYDTWEASYSLYQTCYAWPKGTVFISVVDPGVGKYKRRIVAKTTVGNYIVTPDNSTLTHVSKHVGIEEIREIDESVNRLKGSGESDLFLGRDVYTYTGARLASGIISFEEVGPVIDIDSIEKFELNLPRIIGSEVIGALDIVDVQFGNIWSNIPAEYLDKLNIKFNDYLDIIIYNNRRQVYKNRILYGKSFTSVKKGEDLIYQNAIGNLAIGTSVDDFAAKYELEAGIGWAISIITK